MDRSSPPASSPVITVIGAGSASFGLNTLAALMASSKLEGASLRLVDRNAEALDGVASLAGRLNREWQAGFSLSKHSHHREALPGAGFVVLAIEVPPREGLWRSDFEIPLRHGVRQPYAENGGPGGFAHAARNIGPVLEIVRDMEAACPQAWLLNFSNPMARICDAVARYTSIQVVGLCHQINAGYAMVAKTLEHDLGFDIDPAFTDCHASPETNEPRGRAARQAREKVQITAAGLNHFTWMLGLHEKGTGRDLYPLFRERWDALPDSFEPLTRRVFSAFGLFPIPGDEHLCEYLPWMSDPLTRPWEKFDLSLYDWDYWARRRDEGHKRIRQLASGELPLEPLREVESEGALEIIENIAAAGSHVHLAVNLPNRGQISNLPPGAIVETPAAVSGAGVQPIDVGPLPEPVAELLRREAACSKLCVDAAVHGDRQAALQCLLLDPTITDMDTAQAILDNYLEAYREYLPQFWEQA